MDLNAREQWLAQGPARVAVMGLGYVGLPIALAFIRAGCDVSGIEIDADKIAHLLRGESYLNDIPADAIRAARETGRFHPTADAAALAEMDAVVICVPTPFTAQKEPDTSFIAAAAGTIAAHLRPAQVIILRSTSYPGTTNGVVRPVLEAGGLQGGRDFFLAFAPERIDPGNRQVAIEDVPIVVGGINPASADLAGRLLGRISRRIVPVSSPEAAEMSKLLENVFRNVNIALVNQIAQLCDRMGLDVWEIVEAAGTKPFGFMSFRPGLVGGHCIPVDPYFLAWKARKYDFHMDFIELAARVNEEMPLYVVNRLLSVLQERGVPPPARVLVLGVAFKRDVDDVRHSPALKVIELLQRRHFDVRYHDPYVREIVVNGETMSSAPLNEVLLRGVDCVLILTDHSALDYERIVASARLVFDTRNATAAVRDGRDRIHRL